MTVIPSAPRRRFSLPRALGILAVLALLAAACGQKPGVHIAGAGEGGAGGPVAADGTATPGAPTGDAGAFAADGTTTDPGTAPAGTTAGGDVAAGGSAPAGGGGGGGDPAAGGEGQAAGQSGGEPAGGGGGGQAQPRGQDRTGAGADKIIIGIHAPVTGAAPLPSRSFEEGRDLYWNWWIDHQGNDVLGRKQVEVVFRDDKYNPSSAIQACREMAQGQNAFLLIGGGGTDQIQACGRWANQNGVPYFSAGVTEKGLRGLPYYFASSMSYKQQADLLGQLVKKNFGGKKAAMIVTDTPNFDDAVEGWEAAVQKHGIPYHRTYRHPKGDESWYDTAALEFQREGVEVVYPLTSPVDYIKFAKRAQAQGYNPQYAGVGITMGLNTVADAACPAADGAMFFSPFPGIDAIDKMDPAYRQTAQKEGYNADDLGLALWGVNKSIHALLQRYAEFYGNDLTREDFRAVVEQAKNVETGIFPTVSYSPEDHFGASTVHLLQADCSRGQGQKYVTRATFASGF